MNFFQKIAASAIKKKLISNCPADIKDDLERSLNDPKTFDSFFGFVNEQRSNLTGVTIDADAIKALSLPTRIEAIMLSNPRILKYLNIAIRRIAK